MKKLNKDWETIAPKLFLFEKTSSDPKATAKRIRDFYFGDKEVSFENKEILINLVTDRFFFCPARYSAKQYLKHAPVYLYWFDHKPENNILDVIGAGKEFKMGKFINCIVWWQWHYKEVWKIQWKHQLNFF